MKKFLQTPSRKPVGGVFLAVKRERGPETIRLTPGAHFEWMGKSYFVDKGGSVRRLYK